MGNELACRFHPEKATNPSEGTEFSMIPCYLSDPWSRNIFWAMCLLRDGEAGAIQMFWYIADTRLNSIGTGTTRAGFRGEEQAVCRNHAEPTTAS